MRELTSDPTQKNIGITLALCCGMRIGEVCALRWEDIDMVRRVITVCSTIGRIYNCDSAKTLQLLSTPKTRNSYREIPVSPILLECLRKVRKLQISGQYVVGDGRKPKDQRCYREYFNRLLKRLNIPHIVFHGLRHTFATRCIESQCDYKTVSVILGHSNVATTLNLYVHPNIDQKKRCIARMNKFVGM